MGHQRCRHWWEVWGSPFSGHTGGHRSGRQQFLGSIGCWLQGGTVEAYITALEKDEEGAYFLVVRDVVD